MRNKKINGKKSNGKVKTQKRDMVDFLGKVSYNERDI